MNKLTNFLRAQCLLEQINEKLEELCCHNNQYMPTHDELPQSIIIENLRANYDTDHEALVDIMYKIWKIQAYLTDEDKNTTEGETEEEEEESEEHYMHPETYLDRD